MVSTHKIATAAIVLVLTVCLAKARQDNTDLSGQPSWFALGNEVYQEDDRFEAEKGVLAFNQDPRWFLGIPKKATKAEYESWAKAENITSSNILTEHRDDFQIPTSPPYPNTIKDLPSEAQGATLKLHISKGSKATELIFALSLKAEKQAIKREVEHRWTNVLPFLFAFYADGKAVKGDMIASARTGGSNRFIELVSAGSSKEWKIKVDVRSFESLAGPRVQELSIVAAFSERQHEDSSDFKLRAPEIANEASGNVLQDPQITIRSNVFRIKRTAQGWQPAQL